MMAMILALLFPVLVIPWYTLAYRGRAISLVLATIVILAVCDSAAYGLVIAVLPVSGSEMKELIRPFLLIQLGGGLSVLFSTLVIRWCGLRMIRQAKA